MQDLQYQKQVNGKCKIFTITLWSENSIPDYYLLTQTVYVMNFKKKIHTKNVQAQRTI